MKHYFFMLAMMLSFTAIQAQGRVKQDTTNMIINPDDLKTDSVKRGQEVYTPGSNKADSVSQKSKPKKKVTPANKEATKPQ